MDPLLVYTIAYVLTPSVTIGALLYLKLRTQSRAEMIAHAGVAIASIIAISFADQAFPLIPDATSLAAFIAAGLLLHWMLGKPGALYAGSAALQELCILSTAWLLMPHVDLIMLWLLIVPIFAITHLMTPKRWPQRLLATTSWGTISLLIFVITTGWLWSATLHALGGALLIKKGWFSAPTTAPQSG